MLDLYTLNEAINESFKRYRDRRALEIKGSNYTYQELYDEALSIADKILDLEIVPTPFVAVCGYRSKNIYASILGVLLSGYAYVPINPKFPAQRSKRMLELSGCKVVILCAESTQSFFDCAAGLYDLVVICVGEKNIFAEIANKMPQHKFIFLEDNINTDKNNYTINVLPNSPAYLLFTSGSTGTPKGVVVSHKNVCAYLHYTIKRYQVSSGDRFSQMFDLTFDLSVHDIFACFLSGACLCVVPEGSLMAPAKFIRDNRLTFWFSVPSVVMFMEKMRILKPGIFPTLRYSLFCGEALPERSACLWQEAAPNSTLENLYGPTETTIAISNYRWNRQKSPLQCVNGIVPIGWIFDKHTTKIIDGNNNEALSGELCISGQQVTGSYLSDKHQTDLKFVHFVDSDKVWYKTGDLVKQDVTGCLYYLGRVDEQVQIRGYRVELQEIDSVLRRAAGTNFAACSVLKHGNGEICFIYAFVQGEDNEELRKKIMRESTDYLPEYMVPTKICFIKNMPLNINGKIDRGALKELV